MASVKNGRYANETRRKPTTSQEEAAAAILCASAKIALRGNASADGKL